ncbi:cell division protein FtsQ [Kaistia algarum]|uniref:cell division protein FtsQ/DivIB n=1 Tax=Kaistia algarum TaxID=2083279 RepID=UPI000CE7603C|nr:cell division protein FtsQ/DivIB [Kaistia algarum]MCX5515945.1 FtsQ-type POTRA domain-containing protein [Kaistia algarum]PPE80692.1 cell division protein FtsQ [Kaistia algarum]
MRQISRRKTGQTVEGLAASAGAVPTKFASWFRRRMKVVERMDWRLPAHVGVKGLAVLFAATAIAGIVSAGRVDEVVGEVSHAAGLVVDNVRISGQMETSEVAVLDKLELNPDASLPFINVEAAKARIETLPWVQQATLRKIYPSTLKITIDERVPFALWQHDQSVSVIDQTGRVIGDAGEVHNGLLRLIGKGAETRVDEALSLVDPFPALRDRLKAAVLVGERRWDLVLDNGVTLMLPEEQPATALAQVAAFDASNGLLSKDIVSLDLRLGDRMFVRLSPDAAAKRLAAIKEQEKLAKRRGAST